MESPLGVRSEELSLKWDDFVAEVNDPSTPQEVFKQRASQCKLTLDAYEDDSYPVDDSFRSSNSEPRSYDDQESFDESCQEQQVPTLSQGCATPLTFDVAASQNTTTSRFSHAASNDALTEETKHLLDTESPAKISPTGFENVGSEDEPEAIVKVRIAQAITLQRLSAKKAGPYEINGAHSKANFRYDPGVSWATQHQPGR
ncbi:hypothetical protein CONLIGDRAFT_626607 [Coniochaeta ligniaria NRRL 30616]|uniref:Uncharacterized protein n=1 Tax=Coniochaeta ligniaria NRRL 30616 TaxID=1408157 RepID=A0A1J7JWX0_9PEZI|nr:hypothetical protein CONLIGDRAFT_626607 [Coniochaeta ligniaria NRRL 30616]